jgi:hypothetical protein
MVSSSTYIKEDDMLYSPEVVQNENNKAIKGIKGFYSKIHEEIAQLKHILLDNDGGSEAR